MITITLPGSIRIKKNSRKAVTIPRKSGKPYTIMVPGAPYKRWEAGARKAAMAQLPPLHRAVIEGPVHVRVTAHYKGSRPDLSGVLESVGDCLEGILWADDRQIVSWDGSRVYHDVQDPRTVVEVEAVEDHREAAMPLFEVWR